MKIVTASSGKKSLKLSKTDWLSIGRKAGWAKTSGTLDTAEGKFELPENDTNDTNVKPISDDVLKGITDETEVKTPETTEAPKEHVVKAPSNDWLSEPEAKPTPFTLLNKKVRELLLMNNPIIMAKGIELSELGDGKFELQFGKKKFVGKAGAINKLLQEFKDKYSEVGE
jgi:hypothetical protein